MESFLAESITLPDVTADSLLRFNAKFQSFIAANPDAKSDKLYSEIQENIQSASLILRISIDADWDGTDIYEPAE